MTKLAIYNPATGGTKEVEPNEDFLIDIEKEANTKGLSDKNYKVVGLPFFNEENRMLEFEKSINDLISKL